MTTGPNLNPGQVLPVSRRLSRAPDPMELFARITGDGTRPDTLLLESADSVRGVGLRSILVTGCAVRASCTGREVRLEALSANGASTLPYLARELKKVGHLKKRDDVLIFEPAAGEEIVNESDRLRAPSCLDAVRAMTLGWQVVTSPGPLSMICPGVFAYDFVEHFEALPPTTAESVEFPDFVFWLPEEMVVIDHESRRATAFRHVYGGANAHASYHEAARGIEALSASIAAAPEKGPHSVPRARGNVGEHPDVEVDLDDATFGGLVEELREHIFAGDIFQAVVSRTFRAPCTDPLKAYGRLRVGNPSPYMFYVRMGEDTLFGASPETSVRVTGQPLQVEICPIAGTRRRGFAPDGSIDPDLDGRMEADLRLDAKELAEHMMLVDLARNDVARVSRPGTRLVTRLLGVDRYSHVMHLVSHVRGDLAADLDALHAYVGSMNMGTLVGAPKVRAAELIRGLECDRRGPYGGAVGYLTPDGQMDTAIIIRSALVQNNVAYVRAGAGVVADSDPVAEAEESRRKAQAVLRALVPESSPSKEAL
ncbi:MAG: anthranilate synthase component 1 [Bradymonadaceae bacterium]